MSSAFNNIPGALPISHSGQSKNASRKPTRKAYGQQSSLTDVVFHYVIACAVQHRMVSIASFKKAHTHKVRGMLDFN